MSLPCPPPPQITIHKPWIGKHHEQRGVDRIELPVLLVDVAELAFQQQRDAADQKKQNKQFEQPPGDILDARFGLDDKENAPDKERQVGGGERQDQQTGGGEGQDESGKQVMPE